MSQKMLRYGSKKQIKILVGKALYMILSSLAYIRKLRNFFADSSGTRNKECDFWVKPSSLGKTFLWILDPEIPRFVDFAQIFHTKAASYKKYKQLIVINSFLHRS